MHAWKGDDILVLFTIRGECHTSVEEHFKVWPYLVEPVCVHQFHHPFQHREHPRRNTTDVGHVPVLCIIGNLIALLLEIAQQSNLLWRNTGEVDQRRHILNQDGAEVTHQTVRSIQIRSMTASENQTLSGEQLTFRIDFQITGHTIGTTQIVYVLQTLFADRDELTLVVCRTR